MHGGERKYDREASHEELRLRWTMVDIQECVAKYLRTGIADPTSEYVTGASNGGMMSLRRSANIRESSSLPRRR